MCQVVLKNLYLIVLSWNDWIFKKRKEMTEFIDDVKKWDLVWDSGGWSFTLWLLFLPRLWERVGGKGVTFSLKPARVWTTNLKKKVVKFILC